MTIENLRELKQIDDALLIFGQYLDTYYDPAAQSLSSPDSQT